MVHGCVMLPRFIVAHRPWVLIAELLPRFVRVGHAFEDRIKNLGHTKLAYPLEEPSADGWESEALGAFSDKLNPRRSRRRTSPLRWLETPPTASLFVKTCVFRTIQKIRSCGETGSICRAGTTDTSGRDFEGFRKAPAPRQLPPGGAATRCRPLHALSDAGR